jgi:HlyD family secretion protein
MSIVPQDEPLQAEVLLRNEDVGFTAVGQAVTLKVAAYPFQKYGLLRGRVALLAADALDPANSRRSRRRRRPRPCRPTAPS